jgi:hypothetical protein
MDLHEISPELVLVDPELAALARLQLPEPGSFWASNVPSPPTARSAVGVARPLEATARDKRRRNARRPLLLLAAASLTLNALFIGRAAWPVPRPSLLTNGSSVAAYAGDLLAGPVDPASAALISAPLGTASASRRSQTAATTTRRREATGAFATATNAPRRRGRGRADGLAPVAEHKPQWHPGTLVRRRTRHAVSSLPAAELPAPPAGAGEDVTMQTVAWEPVRDATYYNLVLWRDGERVLDLWPASSRAVVPRNWSRNGVQGLLLPGRYQWFVYPGFGAKASQQYGTLAGNGSFVVATNKGG